MGELSRNGGAEENAAAENPMPENSGRASGSPAENFWAGAELIPCADGKWRLAQPRLECVVAGLPFRLADGSTREGASRRGLLAGFGNAIVPQVAAEFIAAYMEVRGIAAEKGAPGPLKFSPA